MNIKVKMEKSLFVYGDFFLFSIILKKYDG